MKANKVWCYQYIDLETADEVVIEVEQFVTALDAQKQEEPIYKIIMASNQSLSIH